MLINMVRSTSSLAPQATLSRLASGQYELKIKGRLTHPHWMAFLFSGLSAAGVSVVSGRAAQDETGWDARWILDFTRSESAPESLDYVAMSLKKPDTFTVGAPVLSGYQIVRRGDQSLEVQLQGPDQIGFLGRVLSRLSSIMLFPIAVEVETPAGQLRDTIVFRGIGGMAPNADAQKSLDILLKSCLRR